MSTSPHEQYLGLYKKMNRYIQTKEWIILRTKTRTALQSSQTNGGDMT